MAPDPFTTILGDSGAAARLREFGRRAAAVDAPVLLTGETGTGKGVLARTIHDASRRRSGPFVAVNCAGVAATLFESEFFGHARGAFTGAQQAHRGLLEQAGGGTLFLDEIAELDLPLQAKLLTALEERAFRRVGGERSVRVDVRVIAATGADLDAAVLRGAFRRDLYHRLVVLSYCLPALRERPADLELLAQRFLELHAQRYARPIIGFAVAAEARLLSHTWPGNIRELEHAVEAAVLSCDGGWIQAHHLPALAASLPTGAPPPAPPAGRYRFEGEPSAEAQRIQDILRACRGNKTRAARMLGMARNTLRLKLRRLEGIAQEPDDDGGH